MKKSSNLVGGIVDRSIVKALADAAGELVPKGVGLPAGAIEELVGAIVQVADTAAIQMADRFAGQIAARLADSKVVDALADKLGDALADKFAERFQNEAFIAAVAGQFAVAFGEAMASTVAVVQLQRADSKGKRKA